MSLFQTKSLPASNAESPLIIPTYDGSGEATHPSVVHNANGWNGYKYWMAMTPYPDANNDYENPSIVASNDGETWVEPEGITNPVAVDPSNPIFQSDPCLVFSNDGNSLYLYYRRSWAGDYTNLYVRSSSDGVTWSAESLLFASVDNEPILTSPAVMYDGGEWVMWVQVSRTLQKYTCDTYNGTFTKDTDCVLNNEPDGYDFWHLDIVKNSGVYHCFIDYADAGTTGIGGPLYFAQSYDGVTWDVQSDPILNMGGTGAWDEERIYKACGLPISGGYDLFYSAVSESNVWKVGRTTLTLTPTKLFGSPSMNGKFQVLSGGMNG